MNSNGENTVRVEVAAHEPEGPRPVSARRIMIWILVIAAAALVTGGLLVPDGVDSKTIPSSMVGDWTSEHPEYSDRYVTLTPNSITFGVGGTSSVKYAVIGIETNEGEGVPSIILHFRDVAGTTFKREVILDPSGSSWFFASQPDVVWQKYGS